MLMKIVHELQNSIDKKGGSMSFNSYKHSIPFRELKMLNKIKPN